MSFVISPTVSSGLPPASWTLSLPLPRQWSVIPPQAGESTHVLSGAVVHSLWKPDVSSATPTYEQEITEAQYATLRAMYEHATVRTWMIACDGRLFEANLEITGADRVQRYGVIKRNIALKLRIVREVVL